MAKVSTYLNFPRSTEEAFNFYKSVFGGGFIGDINRFSDIPPSKDMPPIAEGDKNLVMHVALPILGGHVIEVPWKWNYRTRFGAITMEAAKISMECNGCLIVLKKANNARS